MFTVAESTLETAGFFAVILLMGGLASLKTRAVKIGDTYFTYRDNSRTGLGAIVALIGLVLLLSVVAVEGDYPQITWLVRLDKPNPHEEWEKWQKAVEKAKELQKQIDMERQQRKYKDDK